MKYLDARSSILDGDVIGVQTTSFGGKITQLVQRLSGIENYKISHTGIAEWVEGRLFIVEMNQGGNVYKPLSQWSNCNLTVSRPKTNVNVTEKKIALEEATEVHIPYGFMDLIKIGFRILFMKRMSISQSDSSTQDVVCSVFTKYYLMAIGVDTKDLANQPAPGEVVDFLGIDIVIEI